MSVWLDYKTNNEPFATEGRTLCPRPEGAHLVLACWGGAKEDLPGAMIGSFACRGCDYYQGEHSSIQQVLCSWPGLPQPEWSFLAALKAVFKSSKSD